MKASKILTLASIISTLACANTNANELFNPYIGLNVSANTIKYKDKNKAKALIGFNVGNKFNIGQFYIAPEFEINVMNKIIEEKKDNIEMKDFYSINLNLGYKFNPAFSVFVGVSENYIQLKNLQKNDKKFKIGGHVGFGYNIFSFLTTYFKYEYKNFKIATTTKKSDIHQFSLGANYNF